MTLTARLEIFASGFPLPTSQSFVFGISITPSTITCETCTPWGPNSRARDWDRARTAHFPVAKEAHIALPLTEAVAPVKIRVGGCADLGTEDRSSGIASREKRYPPLLNGDQWGFSGWKETGDGVQVMNDRTGCKSSRCIREAVRCSEMLVIPIRLVTREKFVLAQL